MTDLKKTIGANIRRIREERGMSQRLLSEKIHKEQGTLSGYESGRREPDAATIDKICNILNTTPNELYGHSSFTPVSEEALEIILKRALPLMLSRSSPPETIAKSVARTYNTLAELREDPRDLLEELDNIPSAKSNRAG